MIKASTYNIYQIAVVKEIAVRRKMEKSINLDKELECCRKQIYIVKD